MDIKEIRNMNKSDLQNKAVELREYLMNLKFKASENQLKKIHEIKNTKRIIARIMTVLKSLENKK